MSLINRKTEFSLGWCEEYLLSNAGTPAAFKTTDAKLSVPTVTSKTEDNTKLSKLLSEGFKRPIYWNKYKVIFKNYNDEYIRERIDASFHGVNKLFILPYERGNNVTDEKSYKKYFLPRVKIEIYNIELMVEIFMISQLMTQLTNMAKLEKYQQHKGMIILLVVY